LTGIGLIALPTGILAGAFGEALRTIKTSGDKLPASVDATLEP